MSNMTAPILWDWRNLLQQRSETNKCKCFFSTRIIILQNKWYDMKSNGIFGSEVFYSPGTGCWFLHIYSDIGVLRSVIDRHPLIISAAITSQYQLVFFFTLKSFISYYLVSLIPGTVNKYYFLQSSAFTPAVWDAFIGIFFFFRFYFCLFKNWLSGTVIVTSTDTFLCVLLEMESNIFYWNWIGARKYKCNLNEENRDLNVNKI